MVLLHVRHNLFPVNIDDLLCRVKVFKRQPFTPLNTSVGLRF